MKLNYLPMDFARATCLPLLLLYRMRRIASDGSPYKRKIKGGALVVANHTSFWDPAYAGVAIWYRRMFFLAAEAVMEGKVRGFLLRHTGATRIDRNATDIEAIRKSVDTLKAGHILTIFPQGQIQRDTPLETLKPGAVLIALQAGVPILPLHIVPKKAWYQRQCVVFGEEINPKEYIAGKFPTAKDLDTITGLLAEKMKGLGESYEYL